MFTHETQIRVRYSETDKMNFVYYGHYAQYFEIGRVEALRALGFPYRQLEDEGIMLPVTHFQIRYLKPATYDDLLVIRTNVAELPSVKIKFAYEIHRPSDKTMLSFGETTLVFVDSRTGKPLRCPREMQQVLAPYFQNQ